MPTLERNGPKKQPRERDTRPEGRSATDTAFYRSTPWRKTRKLYLAAHPLCVECQKAGRLTTATVCDHVQRMQDGGAAFDWANLQGLCSSCHARKSGRETHQSRRRES